jgi:hypothetical protein
MLSFVTHTIRPWAARIEQSINQFLLTEADRKAGVYAEFKLDALMRGDTTSRFNAYASALTHMWMTRNEVRKLENMEPVDGGDEFENPNTTAPEENPASAEEDARTATAIAEVRKDLARIDGLLSSPQGVQRELPLPVERRVENQSVTVEVKQKEVIQPRRKLAKIIRDDKTGKMLAAEIIEEPAEDTD